MSVRLNNPGFLLFFTMIVANHTHCQSHEFPYEIPTYEFIHYGSNRFQFQGDSSSYQHFLAKFSRLVREGSGQLSVVHIGGSHLQADIYTDRIRNRFQTFQPGNNGGRGFIFPYTVARTNNPPNYMVSYTGRWSTCKNTQRNKQCPLGLAGISVSTTDTLASISISFPAANTVAYDFNRVRVYYLDDSLSFGCRILHPATVTSVESTTPGCITYDLGSYSDSLILCLDKTGSNQQRFTLLGISLETDDPGLIYHAAGVNGAKIPSFLRCSLLPGQLASLSPDLVVVSLGTNDAYTRYFNAESYRQHYDTLICRIRTVVPEAAILLTVPNDSYLYRRYTNPNTEKVREVILDLGRIHQCGVWDFYGIMGGLNSIIVWQQFGLAKRDRIHFTRKGYTLIGDLFFNAFLKSYDDYIDKRPPD